MTYDEWIFRTPADDACPDCGGDGRVDCGCGGDFGCPDCDGSDRVDCPTCQAEEPDGDYQYERRRDAQIEE